MAEVSGKGFTVEHLTTKDLEGLQVEIPALLQDRNVHLTSIEMLMARPADMYFRATGAPIVDIVNVIVAGGGTLAFMAQEHFDPSSLLDDDDDPLPEDTVEITRILESAEARRGELSSVLLTWSAQGVIYRWQAVAAWAEAFQKSFDGALAKARDEESKSDEERTEERGVAIRSLISEFMSNPVYRSTPPHKRASVAKSLLAEPESSEEYTIQTWGLQALGRRDREESERRNMEIMANLDELARDLVESKHWVGAMTVATRKKASRNYLIEQSDGWCAPASVADELRERASRLS